MQTNSFYSVVEVGDIFELSKDKKYLVTNVLKDKTTGDIFVECGKEIFRFKDVRLVYRKDKHDFWHQIYYRMF